jgi:hypothetical protein
MEAKVQKGEQAENKSACCCQECKMDSSSPVCLRTAAASEDVPKNGMNGSVSVNIKVYSLHTAMPTFPAKRQPTDLISTQSVSLVKPYRSGAIYVATDLPTTTRKAGMQGML